MDKWLAQNLEKIPDHLKKGWDVVAIVSGSGLVRCGKCFRSSTCVKICVDGKMVDSKPIGDYKDGEMINTYSWDFDNHKLIESKSEVIKQKDIKKFYNVELEDGRIICCTMDHKLYVKRKFINLEGSIEHKIIKLKLKEIKEGDILLCI